MTYYYIQLELGSIDRVAKLSAYVNALCPGLLAGSVGNTLVAMPR